MTMRLVLTLDDMTAAQLMGAADAWKVSPKTFVMALLAHRLDPANDKREFNPGRPGRDFTAGRTAPKGQDE